MLRAEPEGPNFMEGYPQLKNILKKARWLQFIQKFRGYNKEVTNTFARYFNGVEVEVGDLKFSVTEASITVVTDSHRKGNGGSKTKNLMRRPGALCCVTQVWI